LVSYRVVIYKVAVRTFVKNLYKLVGRLRRVDPSRVSLTDGIGKRNGTTAATVRTARLLQTKPNVLTTKSADAKNSIVLAVPKVGMKTRTGRKVPRHCDVEIPKMRPQNRPRGRSGNDPDEERAVMP